MNDGTPKPTLVLPELLQGQWSSAVILTYGADLGFFEQRLAGQLARVPLRLVLGDGRRLGEKLAEAATTGQRLKMANRSYLAAPIRHSRAAHAKLILLLGPREGVLVVGSGNLGHDGYASPGELWHVFRYHDEQPQHLDEFAAARTLIEGLAIRELLDPPTIDLLQTLWGTAPWLPTAPTASAAVRHNLDQPLIDQLAAAADWPVREMITHAPFHDPDCAALERLMELFTPERLRVLVSRDTSVDPERLASALSKTMNAALEIIEVTSDPATYIHAKWIHLKGDTREAILTGSANLSRSALLRTAADGNVEAGIITIADPGGFAAMYDHLRRSDVKDAAVIGLTYRSTEETVEAPAHPVVLWSRLDGRLLTIMFDRTIDDELELVISAFNAGVMWTTKRMRGHIVELDLNDESATMVADGGPLTIQMGKDESMPSYSWPYQLAAIRGRLQKAGGRDQLHRIADLPDRDADLYALLQELESSLVFDPVSAWRVAQPGNHPPPSSDGGEVISWEDLDWSRVRRDPRFIGYFTHGRSAGAPPTDIQLILAAIAGRLGDLGVEQTTLGTGADDESELADEGSQDASDTAEDSENELDDELTRRTLDVTTRTRLAFTRFVKRYAAATLDQAFTDELGPIVSAKNSVIFNHLLARLLERGGVDPNHAVKAQVAIWRLLWGTRDAPGLLTNLEADERTQVDKLLEETNVRATTLHAIARSSGLDLDRNTRIAVRDQVRHLIVDDDFDLSKNLLTIAEPRPELAQALVTVVTDLAAESSPGELIDFVLAPLGLRNRSAEWQQRSVRRRAGARTVDYRSGVLEVLAPVSSLTHDMARHALERLAVATFLGGLDGSYLRIRFVGNGSDVAYWDWQAEDGVVMVQQDDRKIDTLDPPWPDWLIKLKQISDAIRVSTTSGAA
ncbi:hypothetical protein [Arthrobacter sp. ISL-65]|uniref:hypothetical protein n=1 Tax=Arthrobacter sp. ISL-65 TaxID=2819112 RepID=UPI001BE9AF30|nr:hypothetical protein [Arthrobacter sp. ISL-65]MBT2550535.1 hypothetical protein [Arthrobacter sp. ISL-65]